MVIPVVVRLSQNGFVVLIKYDVLKLTEPVVIPDFLDFVRPG